MTLSITKGRNHVPHNFSVDMVYRMILNDGLKWIAEHIPYCTDPQKPDSKASINIRKNFCQRHTDIREFF